MQSKQYFTKIKNYPHEKSTEPVFPHFIDKNGKRKYYGTLWEKEMKYK